MEKQRGFTLLELMMVVIIIGILASMALPQFVRTTERARAAEAYVLVGSIRGAEIRLRAQDVNGFYGALGALDVTVGASNNWGVPVITGAGTAAGFVTVARTGGANNGQTVGITFGTGTRCGNFVPENLPACVAD